MCEGKGKSVMISKDRTMSIMLMEDHIRLQIIKDGFALDEAYSLASKVDDVIEENITYAFDNDFGYLTACPTNTGTGMSVGNDALACTYNDREYQQSYFFGRQSWH